MYTGISGQLDLFIRREKAGVAPGIFRRGANSSDEGTKIWFLGN